MLNISQRKSLIFSSYYFANFGLFAFIIAFLPIYLNHIGFTLTEIAVQALVGSIAYMFAGLGLVQILGPKFSAETAVKLVSLIAPILFFLLLQTKDPVPFNLVFFLFFTLRMGVTTIIDTELVAQTAQGEARFEKVRLWGSVGFIAMGLLLGAVLDTFGIILCTQLVLGLLIFQSIVSLSAIKYFVQVDFNNKTSLLKSGVWKIVPILALLSGTALNWMSHAPMYTYLSVYLEGLGWSGNQIALAWNIGVISEILLFLLFSRIEKFFSLQMIFVLSMGLTSLRWIILYNTQDFYILLLSQTLHAFTFGSAYMASIRLAHELFPKALENKSQGMLTFFGLGLGSLIGRVGLSFIAPSLSGTDEIQTLFLYGGLIAVLGLISSFWIFKSSNN